jgi:hypothetical protein
LFKKFVGTDGSLKHLWSGNHNGTAESMESVGTGELLTQFESMRRELVQETGDTRFFGIVLHIVADGDTSFDGVTQNILFTCVYMLIFPQIADFYEVSHFRWSIFP